ncbi:hypothetical protein K431DRAFT_294898 [Polychaeton citri CBS 116435]|uniref:Uncharacterized protein n=1 Tax=Polychaeton citri CBS 116435 TaxID=1314669 RepID=A0A9P4Q585_9PEZI|nr:hypothetical protein K431DRAFT_294898 [Polychaeton citri CBS 116435]
MQSSNITTISNTFMLRLHSDPRKRKAPLIEGWVYKRQATEAAMGSIGFGDFSTMVDHRSLLEQSATRSRRELARMAADHESIVAEKVELHGLVDRLRAELAQVSRERNVATAEKEMASHDAARFESEKNADAAARASQEANELRDELESLQNSHTGAALLQQQHEQQIKSILVAVRELEQQNQELSNHLDMCLLERGFLDKERKELNGSLIDALSRIDDLEKVGEELAEQNRQLGNSNSNLEQSIAEKMEECDDLKQALRDEEREHKDKQVENGLIGVQMTDMEVMLENLERQNQDMWLIAYDQAQKLDEARGQILDRDMDDQTKIFYSFSI